MPSLVGSEMCIRDAIQRITGLLVYPFGIPVTYCGTTPPLRRSANGPDWLVYCASGMAPTMKIAIGICFGAILCGFALYPAAPARIMLLDGESGGPYHKWQLTTPVSYTHLRAHETRHDIVCR